MVYIIMGVAGSGKTTIGTLLSKRIGAVFYDADDFHPSLNIMKMRDGVALSDQDRIPWLQKIARLIDEAAGDQNGEDVVVACSALKESYRTILRGRKNRKFKLIHLTGPEKVLYQRLLLRHDHFMPLSLLSSQLRDLEIPPDALSISIEQSPAEIVDEIINHID